MKLSVMQLESRECPAVDMGGGMVNSHGVSFVPFPDWHGPVNVTEQGEEVDIGAGQGGGPRLGRFDLSGNRLTADVFVGDPNSREGLVPLIVMHDTSAGGGIPYDLSRMGVRLVAGSDPATSDWDALRSQLQHVSPQLVKAYMTAGVAIDAVYKAPITDDPMFASLAGQRVEKYGPDNTTRFDGITGVTSGQYAAVRLDELGDTTALHELGHAVDNYVAHGASVQDDWRGIWKNAKWPADYFRDYPEEAWAESFARILDGKPVQNEVAAYFYSRFGDLMGLSEQIGSDGRITLSAPGGQS